MWNCFKFRKKTIVFLVLLLCTTVAVKMLFHSLTVKTDSNGTTTEALEGALTNSKSTQLQGFSTGLKPRLPSVSSERRLANLKSSCTGHRNSWSTLTTTEKQIVAKHVIVDDEHQILYCYVPKVACANWKRVFRVLDGRAKDVNAIKQFDHHDFMFLEDLPPLAIERRIKTYYKFMFVRDPIERLLSAYKNKLQNASSSVGLYFVKRYGHLMTKHRKGSSSKGIQVTLSDFFQYLSKEKVDKMNEHWMPYYKICQPCAMLYDFIGTLENVRRDSEKVFRHLRIQDKVEFPRKQWFYQDHSKAARVNADLLHSVPRKVLRKLVKKYLKDFKLFSYPIPDLR